MSDAEVKVRVGVETDNAGALDELEKKIDNFGRKKKEQEGKVTPTTPAPAPKPTPAPAPAPKQPPAVERPGEAGAARPSVLPYAYDALERRRDKLKDLRREQKELERMGATKEARGVERRANSLERAIDREGNRLLRVEDDEAKRAKRAPIEEQQQTIAKALTEEAHARAAGNHAAADAMRRETDLMQRALTLQRTKGVSQADALEIAKQEIALKNAGISTPTVGGIFAALGGTALLGTAFNTALGQMEFGESLSNRGHAMRAASQRRSAAIAQRGTSGEAAAESWAAEERAAEIRRNRPQLETENKYGLLGSILKGAAVGAGVGAAAGAPVAGIGALPGAAIGAVIGGITAGVPTYFSGKNKEAQSQQDEDQAEAEAKEKEDLARKKFMAEEGGLQLDALRQRSKRTMAGQREAFADDMAQEWLKTYRDVFNRSKGNTEVATEMADLTVQNNIRDRQAMAGAGLVDAYTGSAGIAAAASWAQQSGGWGDVATKIDGLKDTVAQGNDAYNRENLAK